MSTLEDRRDWARAEERKKCPECKGRGFVEDRHEGGISYMPCPMCGFVEVKTENEELFDES